MTTEINTKANRSWMDTPPLSPPIRHLSGEIVESQLWLDKLSDPLQDWLHSWFTTPRFSKIKNFLHGTWLGHPVHPLITAIPLGSWTTSLVLDATWLASEHPVTASAADTAMLLGLLGASASVVTGLTDWSNTDATDRRVGMLHGLLNTGALLTNLVSYGLRLSGKRRTAIALTSVAYTTSMVAAYLGGELSFAKGIGVNHVAWEAGPDDFTPVLADTDLPEKQLVRVEAAGMPVVLWRENGKIYAMAATCSHLGGPLDEGSVENGCVVCPWHGSMFQLSDGAVVNGPAVYAQPLFKVRHRKGMIEVRQLAHA